MSETDYGTQTDAEPRRTTNGLGGRADTGSGANDEASAYDFSAPSSTGKRLGSDRFIGRVPVALSFPDVEDPWPVVREFNAHLVDFGRRRVQALVSIAAPPEALEQLRLREAIEVPLLSDPDGSLCARFDAARDPGGRICTVLIDTQGEPLDTVRQLPRVDHVLAVLDRIDDLQRDFPDRMATLPDNQTRDRARQERVADSERSSIAPDQTDRVVGRESADPEA